MLGNVNLQLGISAVLPECLLLPFAFIGGVFLTMLAVGLLINGKQCSIAFDQFIGTCVLTHHMADETVSAWAHREHHKRIERFINFLARNPNHCAESYISEMRGTQNAPEYKQ